MMKARFIDAGLDVLTTVKYFRDHAAEYHLDQKILTIGFQLVDMLSVWLITWK